MRIEQNVCRVEFLYPSDADEGKLLEVKVDVDDIKGKGRVTLFQNNDEWCGELTLPVEVLLEIASYVQSLTPAPKPKKAK